MLHAMHTGIQDEESGKELHLAAKLVGRSQTESEKLYRVPGQSPSACHDPTSSMELLMGMA